MQLQHTNVFCGDRRTLARLGKRNTFSWSTANSACTSCSPSIGACVQRNIEFKHQHLRRSSHMLMWQQQLTAWHSGSDIEFVTQAKSSTGRTYVEDRELQQLGGCGALCRILLQALAYQISEVLHSEDK